METKQNPDMSLARTATLRWKRIFMKLMPPPQISKAAMPTFTRLLLPLLFFCSSLSASHADNLLTNSGFEDGLTGWTAAPANAAMFQVTPEAASMGKMGLHAGAATDDQETTTATLSSAAFPVVPAKIYRLTIWGRLHGPAKCPVEIQLQFAGQDGKVIDPVITPSYWPLNVPRAEHQFDKLIMQAAAPSGAVSVVALISVHGASHGGADLDDFSLEEIPAAAAVKTPLPAPLPDAEIQALLTEIKSLPFRGKAPPKVVIKVDDFAGNWAKPPIKEVHHHWLRIANFTAQRKIKLSIGIIAKSLEVSEQPVFDWVKKDHDSGLFEFWLHGYDHVPWIGPDGKQMPEGRGRSAEEQTQRLATCQKLAEDKLGFHFVSYGPTGSGPQPLIDQAFMDSLQNDPYIKNIMYPWPIDQMGKDLQAKGKVVVLDRVNSVNIEAAVGHPRFDVFLEGYAHNRDRDYFIIQGHPALWGWDDTPKNEAFGNFVKIIDFLTSQNVTFVFPSELAESLAATHAYTTNSAAVAPPQKGP